MNAPSEAHLAPLRAVVDMELTNFEGLASGTTQAHILTALGPVYAAGVGVGELPLWMTVHELTPLERVTVWYALTDEIAEEHIDPQQPILWLERPITPEQVADLLNQPDGHRPAHASHLLAWPERGLALYFSRRSGLPTLLLAFSPLSRADFDRAPMTHPA